MDFCAISRTIRDGVVSQVANATESVRQAWLGFREVVILRKTCTSEKVHSLLQARIWQTENLLATQADPQNILRKKIRVIRIQQCINTILSLPARLLRVVFSSVMSPAATSNFTDVIKNRAAESLAAPILDEGRKKLLEELVACPEALVFDIVRGFDSVTVGSEDLVPALMKRNAQESYDLYDGAIRNLVHAANPRLAINESTMDELLYLLVQNFLKLPSEALASDPNIPVCEWPALLDSTVRTISYTMEKNNTTLLYATTLMREHYNLRDETQKHKTTSIGVEARYNLETKEVSYIFYYDRGHNSYMWERKDPFNPPLTLP